MDPVQPDIETMAARLLEIDGIEAVLLGGSRARGDHGPESDHDLGLYYRPPLDVDAVRRLARALVGRPVAVTEPGGWGPWVDGGAWLDVDGARVDWIYRDVDRVQNAWIDAQAGKFSFHRQPGHQLGVPDFAYVGEVALGVVLVDSTGEVTTLREAASTYPPALADAVVEGLWEAEFELGAAHKATGRQDAVYVAGAITHALLICAHALHGRGGSWLVNEKGAIASAGRLALAPPGFAERCQGVLAALGTRPDELACAVHEAEAIVADVRAACGSPAP